MSLAPDPSDKTDAKADGNFGSAGSHRAGYGDKLANAERWARKGGTLNAGEGLILCEEIDRLRHELKHETQWADAGIDSTAFWQKQRDDLAAKLADVEAQRDDLREMANAAEMAETVASAELEHLRRVLAVLREPSAAVMKFAVLHYSGDLQDAIRAAVAAAEREVLGAS